MSGESYDDAIKFRAGPVKEAAQQLDKVHLGGVNVSELAREGLTEMLQRTMTDEDKIGVYEQYEADELSEEAAKLLLGAEFEQLQADVADVRAAAEEDSDEYLV